MTKESEQSGSTPDKPLRAVVFSLLGSKEGLQALSDPKQNGPVLDAIKKTAAEVDRRERGGVVKSLNYGLSSWDTRRWPKNKKHAAEVIKDSISPPKPKPTRASPASPEKLRERRDNIKSLWNSGKSTLDIQRELGLSEGIVTRDIAQMRKQGEDLTRRQAVSADPERRALEEREVAKLKAERVDYATIAHWTGLSPTRIKTILAKNRREEKLKSPKKPKTVYAQPETVYKKPNKGKQI